MISLNTKTSSKGVNKISSVSIFGLQDGSCSGRSTTDALFAILQLMEKKDSFCIYRSNNPTWWYLSFVSTELQQEGRHEASSTSSCQTFT